MDFRQLARPRKQVRLRKEAGTLMRMYPTRLLNHGLCRAAQSCKFEALLSIHLR